MHIEDSPLERTPDLVAKIRALRQQAETQMNQFTHIEDYEVRRVIGRKSKAEIDEQPSVSLPKKKQGKKTEQASIDFQSEHVERNARDGTGA